MSQAAAHGLREALFRHAPSDSRRRVYDATKSYVHKVFSDTAKGPVTFTLESEVWRWIVDSVVYPGAGYLAAGAIRPVVESGA